MTSARHQKSIGTRFSAAARTYTEISHLQEKVARRVMELVPSDVVPRTVLDAGCGPGRLIEFSLQNWPNAHVTGVDIAPGMIQEAASRFVSDGRVSLIEADLRNYAALRSFDLVLSGSALHWIRPFQHGLTRVAGLCRRGGMLAASVMLKGTLGELHASRDAAAPGKIPNAGLPTFDEFCIAARSIADVRVRRIDQSTTEFDLPNAANVLKTVHDMGVTGGEISRREQPLNRGELERLICHYDRHFRTPGGVRVTFIVGYLLLEIV